MTPDRQMRLTALVLALSLIAAIGVQVWIARQSHTPPVVITGDAQVGGPFQLTDQRGRRVSDQDFRGRTLIIYFGWRLDPDLTPAALQVLSAAMRRLGPKSQTMAPVFISVDAERDNHLNLKEFIDFFDTPITALIGRDDEIAALARAFKLYVKRIPDISLPGGYSIDHASLYYVIGSNGEFRGIVPHTTDSGALADSLLELSR